MIIKKILAFAASITSLHILIIFFIVDSNAENKNIKLYSHDEGILSIMYHRFNESKYPSTNIQMDIFKKHIELIRDSQVNFYDPKDLVDNFSIVVLELNDDHRRIVHCWTTTRSEHKEKVKKGFSSETDFYAYCARKIRDLSLIFIVQSSN